MFVRARWYKHVVCISYNDPLELTRPSSSCTFDDRDILAIVSARGSRYPVLNRCEPVNETISVCKWYQYVIWGQIVICNVSKIKLDHLCILWLTFSNANKVCGERINIFVWPYLTSFEKFFSSINVRTPSLSLPPRKFGHVYCDIILYLAMKNKFNFCDNYNFGLVLRFFKENS